MTKLPADLARLEAKAEALLEAKDDTPGKDVVDDYHDALETMLFAAVVIGQRGLVDRVGWLGHLLERLERDDPVPDHDAPITEAITVLLAKLPAEDPRWRRYATSKDARLRQAVAASADPTALAGAAWIEALRRDAVEAVRAVARKRPLEAPVEWWSAAFSFDPWTVVPREQRAGLEAPLRKVVEAADQSVYQRSQDGPAVAEALLALPTPLARDALDRLLLSWSRHSDWLLPVMAHLVAEPGGATWLWQRLARSEDLLLGLDLVDMLGQIPEAQRAAALLELARAVVGSLLASSDVGLLVTQLVSAIGKTWPDPADPLPLVDVAVGLDVRRHGYVRRSLVGVLTRDAHAAAVAPRLLEEWERGEGPLLALLGKQADDVIEAAPAALVRPYAVRALQSEDGARRAWGVAEVLGRCHQPGTDPPREALAAELWGRPATRAAVLEHHVDAIVRPLRAKLRRKEGLAVDEAGALVRAREGRRRVRLDAREWAKLRALRRRGLEAARASGVTERAADGLAALFPRTRWTTAEWEDFEALCAVDPKEAGLALAIVERQTARRTERALARLAEVHPGSGASAALARWRSFHD